ncbi:MAG: sulfatase [bacterium]
MTKSYAVYIFLGAVTGAIGGMILFSSELFLGSIYAQISPGTYLLFLAAYVTAGVFGGSLLGMLSKAVYDKFQPFKKHEANFLPASFVLVLFFLYGFYYINEKLTPGVGVFAPLSLIANILFLLLSLVVFRIGLSSAAGTNQIASFFNIAALPLSGLVALNFRFFLWHSPEMATGELFVAVLSFGAIGIAGMTIARWLNTFAGKRTASLTLALNLVAALGLLVVFAWSGRPSAASFLSHEPVVSSNTLPSAKNIIWIVMDTARRDQISIYGGDRVLTPNIDALSEDALVFSQAVSSAPWTIPSHASMFTGMFPSKHAAHRGVPGGKFTNPLAKENVTIAEMLSERGFQTACVAANVAGLSRQFGLAQGFDYYFDGRPIAYSLFWGKLLSAMPEKFRANVLRTNEICLSSEINGIAFDWLEQRTPKEPFFLFINYMEPHDGVEYIPEPYHSLFGFDQAEYERVFSGFQQSKVVHFEQEVTPEQFEMVNRLLARRIYFMDHHIGNLIQKLQEGGLYDNAFIIITSDHGELNGEHNSFGHNTDLYNELVWVPLIVKYPGSAQTGVIHKTVQNIDIMPELLSQLGIEIPDEVQGQPFEQVSHEIIAELFEQKKAQALLYPERYYRDLRAIFANIGSDSLKYIWASNGKLELYDMRTDRKELNNLAEKKPEFVTRLDERMTQWESSFSPVTSDNKGKMKYTKEIQDRLRSLGYIK